MTVLLFTGHRLHGPQCMIPDCQVCMGGLSLCETCGGAEGAMPTECPQERMTWTQTQAVYAGEADFLGGRWVGSSVWRPDRIAAVRMGYPDVDRPRRGGPALPADTFPEHPYLHPADPPEPHLSCRCTLHVSDPPAE